MGRGMIAPRIKRLENLVALNSAPSDQTEQEWTPEMRARAVKNITLHALARIGEPAIDPFPDLDGRDYLAVWWPWVYPRWESWPAWAKDAAARIGHPSKVGLVFGVADGKVVQTGTPA